MAPSADAEGRWRDCVAPEVARLEAAIYAARQDLEWLAASQERATARWGRLAGRGRMPGAPLTCSLTVWPSIGMRSRGSNAARRAGAGAPFGRPPRCRPHTFSQGAGRDFGPDL